MRGIREISIKVNVPEEEEDLKELEERKAKVVVDILKEKYGEMILEEYVSSIRGKRGGLFINN